MIEKVSSAIERYNMLEKGERVLCALSGGADSTALLLCLKELGYDVFAVHVNHNLRGEESLSDQLFCERLCKKYGLPFKAVSVDVSEYAAKNRLSTELAARELRYRELERLSGGAKIATAHTLSDSLETAIFNLTRGCGLKGLTGIPPVRENIVRPLCECTREDVEEFLKARGQDFVTDSTNLIADCSRNVIRLNVIPELKKINPGLEKSFKNSLFALKEADGFIYDSAKKFLSPLPDGSFDLSGADGAELSRAAAEILLRGGVEPSFERIGAVKKILRENGRINLKKGVYLRSVGGKLKFERDPVVIPETPFCFDEDAEVVGKKITVTKISPFDISRFNKDELRYMIDISRIGGEYTLRSCSGNEKIRLPGRGFGSVIKKLISKVPPEKRGEIIVISDAEGAVFVEGVGVSERVCCGENTVAAVRIDISDEKEREI